MTAETSSPTQTIKPTPQGPYAKFMDGKPFAFQCVVNTTLILAFLYLFLLGLSLMGDGFKGVSGKTVGNLVGSIENPLAGLGLGVVATVLLQSSSTTTSIIVTMVGAELVTVTNAIPMVMGANIGTSVTNTIVAHFHITEPDEFTRGFAGATVHDAFNFLTVLLLFPVEVVIAAISGQGLLARISEGVRDGILGTEAPDWDSPAKAIISPIKAHFIKIDKTLIKDIAKGCTACKKATDDDDNVLLNAEGAELCYNYVQDETELLGYAKDTIACVADFCYDYKKVEDEDGEDVTMKFCISREEWDQVHLVDSQVVKSGFASSMGDEAGATTIIVISLIFLCIALYGIVRILHYLVLSSGRVENTDGSLTPFVKWTRKILGMHPALSIFYGMCLTIAVQSSSITTSALTPLVALGIITLEEMLPLTLGANIGTTCTAFIASGVLGKPDSVQVSICHFLFNVIGILVWYVHPAMRAIPIGWAKMMGQYGLTYKWFGGFYIAVLFVSLPLIFFALSFLLQLGAFGIILNVLLDVALVGATYYLFKNFDKLMGKEESAKEAADVEKPAQA